MRNKVEPKVHAVFIHVRDLKKSAQWYSRLLGLPFDASKVESPVYNLPVEGDTYVTLDDHQFDPEFTIHPFKNPAFNFYSKDLLTTLSWVKEEDIPITRRLETVEGFGWFQISDPDGNVVMICGDVGK